MDTLNVSGIIFSWKAKPDGKPENYACIESSFLIWQFLHQ